MNEESVFIDLDKEVDEKTVKEAELSANAAVWENHPITLHYVPYTELGKYGLRKKNDKLRGIVRLVDIKEGDTCTCCGTHPPFTGMVGLIKVIRFNRYKGGSRIEFLCGKRAVEAINAVASWKKRAISFLSKVKKSCQLWKNSIRKS